MAQNKTGRIYVCHTFYHVYVSYLKELNLPKEEQGRATMVLSKMSNNFEDLGERILESKIFKEVYEFDEKRREYFPELTKWYTDHGNIISNMFSRIVFTKKFAKLEAPFVPVDFKKYKDIYVFCDADPIGLYLNQNHIKYHSVEDGLDTLVHFNDALIEIQSHPGIKKFFSMKLNLIFIRDGYSKYCIDMEVNDLTGVPRPLPKYFAVSRNELADKLTTKEKELLIKVFVKDYENLKAKINSLADNRNMIMILTEPLCTLDIRERIFRDLVNEYSQYGTVFLKPHPRDELDYKTVFADVLQFEGSVPMEMFNFYPGLHFSKVVSVFTELGSIRFADETQRLGPEFMDKYEAPEIHRRNAK